MLFKRLLYFLLFCFCIWLALATRSHSDWFIDIVKVYGGDVIWAAAFLFLLRAIFLRTNSYKLAIISYVLGVLDEFSQLLTFHWIVAIRSTYIGRLMLGVGFVWSDLICYAVGVLLALFIVLLSEEFLFQRKTLKSA